MTLPITENVESRKLTEMIRDRKLETTLVRIFTIGNNTTPANDPASAAVLELGPQIGEGYPGGADLVVNQRTYDQIPPDAIRLTCTYGPPDRGKADPSEVEYELDLGTESQHIERAYGQTHFPSSEDGVGRLIGVEGDKIAGCDILVPVEMYREVRNRRSIDQAFVDLIRNTRGRVNSAAWKGYAAREVFFRGVRLSRRGQGDLRIAYEFAILFNAIETIRTVAGDQSVTKSAWDYLWLQKGQRKSLAGKLEWIIQAAHVARVYDEADFSALGLGDAPWGTSAQVISSLPPL